MNKNLILITRAISFENETTDLLWVASFELLKVTTGLTLAQKFNCLIDILT